MTEKKGFRTRDLVLIAIFAAMMAVCAWISVPVLAVPFTLQSFGVFMALLCLGGKRGTAAICVYVLLGAVGAPVFSGFNGGVGAIMGATGGYIIGFIFSGLIYWLICALSPHKGTFLTVLACLAALCVCYLFGTFWFMTVYTGADNDFISVAAKCVLPFIIPDLLKLLLALKISSVVKRHVSV